VALTWGGGQTSMKKKIHRTEKDIQQTGARLPHSRASLQVTSIMENLEVAVDNDGALDFRCARELPRLGRRMGYTKLELVLGITTLYTSREKSDNFNPERFK